MKKELSQPYGKIEGLGFVKVLLEIEEKGLSGILRIERGNIIKEIYFDKGRVINARSNLTRETLGRVLLERGFISQEDYARSLEEMKRTGKKQGEVLMKMGVLPLSLNKALQMQAEQRIIDVFSWNGGNYRFINNEEISGAVENLNLDLKRIVYEGIIKKLSPEITEGIFKEFMQKKLVFRADGEVSSRIKLKESHLEFLKLFDGKKITKEVITSSRLNAMDASKAIAAGILLNILKVVEEEKVGPPGEVTTPLEDSILTERDKGMLAVLEKTLREFKSKNYLEIFNLREDFTDAEIKKAYFQLARSFHPDRFAGFHRKVKGVAEEIFSLINEAYGVLSNKEERSNYLAMIKTAGRVITEKDAQAALSAEMEFQKGEVLLKAGKLEEALKHFSKACELNREEEEYRIFLGWVTYRLGKREKNEIKAKEGRRLIEQGVQRSPDSEKGHFFLAQIYKIEGDVQRAVREFERVLQINSENADARMELRVLQQRVEREKDKPKGIFGKFFK